MKTEEMLRRVRDANPNPTGAQKAHLKSVLRTERNPALGFSIAGFAMKSLKFGAGALSTGLTVATLAIGLFVVSFADTDRTTFYKEYVRGAVASQATAKQLSNLDQMFNYQQTLQDALASGRPVTGTFQRDPETGELVLVQTTPTISAEEAFGTITRPQTQEVAQAPAAQDVLTPRPVQTRTIRVEQPVETLTPSDRAIVAPQDTNSTVTAPAPTVQNNPMPTVTDATRTFVTSARMQEFTEKCLENTGAASTITRLERHAAGGPTGYPSQMATQCAAILTALTANRLDVANAITLDGVIGPNSKSILSESMGLNYDADPRAVSGTLLNVWQGPQGSAQIIGMRAPQLRR